MEEQNTTRKMNTFLALALSPNPKYSCNLTRISGIDDIFVQV
jgi:hypothetical protein